MRWRFRPALWIALVTTGFAGMCHAQTSRVADRSDADVARQLFQRFLERLRDDVPVAGEFEIKRTPAKGLGRGLPQQDRLLRCRWAWDRDREMLEGLPESNLFEHFLSTRRALLLGMGPKNYNLSGPKYAYPLCPSGFYFLVGSVPWFDHANDEVRLVESDADTTPGTKVVRVQLRPKGHVHLFIRERDGRHLGHDTFWEGQVFHRLRISKLMNYSDGRAFPRPRGCKRFCPRGLTQPLPTSCGPSICNFHAERSKWKPRLRQKSAPALRFTISSGTRTSRSNRPPRPPTLLSKRFDASAHAVRVDRRGCESPPIESLWLALIGRDRNCLSAVPGKKLA